MRESEWQSRPFVQELRQNLTRAETLLWHKLRGKRMSGYRFRRQYPIECFIVDFACLSEKLAIEIDGTSHDEEEACAYDAQRTYYLENLGWHVLRFKNDDVFDDVGEVVEAVFLYLQGLSQDAPPSECRVLEQNALPTSPVNGGGRL